MKLYGLTGGIGMGKSTAAACLAPWEIPLADSDLIARQVVEPGTPALREIVAAFGPDMLLPEGRLNRARLAERVFADPAARRQLETIVHPRIREVWLAQAQRWRQEDRLLAVVVIPLLFETQAQSCFDVTVCVACSAATQQARLRARGWTSAEISQRLAAQWPIEQKIRQSDFLLWNEGPLDLLVAQWQRILGFGLPGPIGERTSARKPLANGAPPDGPTPPLCG